MVSFDEILIKKLGGEKMSNYYKIKCKLYYCYDIDGEFDYTFENKISYKNNNDFCFPIETSKYNKNNFNKLIFNKKNISEEEQIYHLMNIQNYSFETAKQYFVNYESFCLEYENIELYIFPTKEEFEKSFSPKYYCVIEDYELSFENLPVLKLNLNLNYVYGSNIDWNLYTLEKITCDKKNNLLRFHSINRDVIENYIDEDLEEEIKKIKEYLNSLGIKKEFIIKYSDKFEIDFRKIKSMLMFENIKKEEE